MGERILSAAFAPDARRVLLTGAAGVAELWDLGGVTPPSDGRLCVASDDGTRFIVQSNGLNIVEDTATGASIGQGIFGDTPVQNILLSAHGHYAAAVSENSSEVKVIEIAAGKQTGPFQFSGPRQFVVSDDGAYLAATSAGFVEVISATNGKRLFSEQQDYGETNQVRFADDGVWMVVWGGHMIEELNPANGALRFPRLQFPQFVREANINSDETMLIGCASDDQFTACYAQVYDFKTGKALTPKLRQSDGILCCAFSHDNTKVATGGEDFTAYLWNMDGKRIGHPIRHEEQVSGISLNADASMLLTASRDKTARLWDGETGDPLSPPLRCDRIVLKAHFVSKDQILTLSTGNIGRLWPLETDTRPPQDIVDEASLLAGGVLDSEPTNKAAWLAETFERLRKKYPARFHASLPEAIRWHQEVVRESVAKGDVATAEFHRKQIALLENDKALETGGTARNAQ
jgi:WD40 repeat protein